MTNTFSRPSAAPALIIPIIIDCKNPNKPDEFGNTAIHLASELKYFGIIKELIPSNWNFASMNHRGENCLASVVKNASFVKEHVDVVKMLIDECKKQNVFENIYQALPKYLKFKLKTLETTYKLLPSKKMDY